MTVDVLSCMRNWDIMESRILRKRRWRELTMTERGTLGKGEGDTGWESVTERLNWTDYTEREIGGEITRARIDQEKTKKPWIILWIATCTQSKTSGLPKLTVDGKEKNILLSFCLTGKTPNHRKKQASSPHVVFCEKIGKRFSWKSPRAC